MSTFKDLFTNFVLIGLVIFSMIAFVYNVQSDNNVNDTLSSNPVINSSFKNLDSELNSLSSKSQGQKDSFDSENPTGGLGSILMFSIVSGGKIFGGMIASVFNAVISMPKYLLGLDPIIISVIGTLLIVAIIVTLWLLYKLGGG